MSKWLSFLPPTQWLTEYSARYLRFDMWPELPLLPMQYRSRSPTQRWPACRRRSASTAISLAVSAMRSRILAPARDRADLGDLADDRQHGGRHGGRGRARYAQIASLAAFTVAALL